MSPPPTIIIAEPDPMISSVLRVEFSRWDFAVLLATSIEEADAYSTHTVASLVVLDSVKAHVRAFEACARIRRRKDYAGRPIVLTTQEISARTKAAAETAGATVLLGKPYSVFDLFQAVTPHLRADDPLLQAGLSVSGVAHPASAIWRRGQSAPPGGGHESALARNGALLPIVRVVGERVPVIGKIP